MVWLRVIALDSSKLSATPVSKIFAPLADAAIDLVVTNDGEGVYSGVPEFWEAAKAGAVSTAVVITERTGGNGTREKSVP
jgi:hypothetical protein